MDDGLPSLSASDRIHLNADLIRFVERYRWTPVLIRGVLRRRYGVVLSDVELLRLYRELTSS